VFFFGHQLIPLPVPPGGQHLPEPLHVVGGRDLARIDPQSRFPGHAHPRRRQRAVPRPPVHLRQPRVGQVPGLDARGDQGRDHPVHPRALPGGGRGVDDLLHVPRLNVLAQRVADHRDSKPLAQPALGVRVLAGPPPVGGQAVGVEVVRDQVGAGTLHVRRVGGQPLGDLLQPGGQPLPGHRLALPAAAVLVPDRAPPVLAFPRGVDRDAVLQLDHRVPVAAGGRAPGSAREDRAACCAAGPRPGGTEGPGQGRLWVFCGISGPRGR
jgi:hypothetical protein